jgi:RimJ/RimL family protein N-acetyltransferase
MGPVEFDFQPTLIGDTLTLRPLVDDDFDALHAAAADPKTWAGHPAQDRYKRDVFEHYFRGLMNAGGTLAFVDHKGGLIGCSRYYIPPDRPDDISIGSTFLDNRYWGGETNRLIKKLMLAHAFQTFETVWFHIAPTNIRSQKATIKLGASHAYDATLPISGSPALWMCFSLKKSQALTLIA